jgi:hypothetical protein
MIVKVTGCKNEKLKQEIIKASHFFAKELLSHQMIPHIEVKIMFKTRLVDLGNCMITHVNEWNKPRTFEIQLRKGRSLTSTLCTLAHEFVHLKQFARNELADDHSYWKGFYIDPETIDYEDQPWEIEAAFKERILFHLYRDVNTPPSK